MGAPYDRRSLVGAAGFFLLVEEIGRMIGGDMVLRVRRWFVLPVVALICILCGIYLKSTGWSGRRDISVEGSTPSETTRPGLSEGEGTEVTTGKLPPEDSHGGESAQGTTASEEVAPATHEVSSNVSLQEIRVALDKSLGGKGLGYVGHMELSRGPNAPSTFSFIYGSNTDGRVELNALYDVVDEAQRQIEEGQTLMEEARKDENREEVHRAAKLLVEGDKSLVQEERFVTIETATKKDQPPILVYHKGLPDWLILRGKALDLAEQYLLGPVDVREVRKYQFASCIFVCEGNGGEVVYVVPNENEVFAESELVETPQPTRRSSQEEEEARSERVQAQWEEFLGAGFDVDTLFSVSDLRDLSQER